MKLSFIKLLRAKCHYGKTDESGNYIGSSYCFATAREWAKLRITLFKKMASGE
ncbi:MAG: hypothetical protein R2879_13280 [Saprospiraceae bacterium]